MYKAKDSRCQLRDGTKLKLLHKEAKAAAVTLLWEVRSNSLGMNGKIKQVSAKQQKIQIGK
jgi:hypothetical protein